MMIIIPVHDHDELPRGGFSLLKANVESFIPPRLTRLSSFLAETSLPNLWMMMFIYLYPSSYSIHLESEKFR